MEPNATAGSTYSLTPHSSEADVSGRPAAWESLTHTADGAKRASAPFTGFRTLWFNTGSQCNIACASCYIESSPSNDRLAYLTLDDVTPFLNELDQIDPDRRAEIGFTGGEPFLNPHMNRLAEAALARGRRVLILTNAMRPMQRPATAAGLARLAHEHGRRLTLRVSLDHHTAARHDAERGAGSFEAALQGLALLRDLPVQLAIAGRAGFCESEAHARTGYAALFARLKLPIDVADSSQLVLFPDMDPDAHPPEITEACWTRVGVDPADLMCASSRMIARRAGAQAPTVTPCTLIAYDTRVDRGPTLKDAMGPTTLTHKFCAQFCVLGGASCSAG